MTTLNIISDTNLIYVFLILILMIIPTMINPFYKKTKMYVNIVIVCSILAMAIVLMFTLQDKSITNIYYTICILICFMCVFILIMLGMHYIKQNSTETLLGMYTILFIATILLMGELLYFYLVLAPETANNIEDNINDIADKFAKSICKAKPDNMNSDTPSDIDIHLTSTARMLKDRDERLHTRHNRYVLLTGILIVVFFIMGLYKLTLLIGKDSHASYRNAHLISLITIICIVCFQYIFIDFGKKYKFTGVSPGGVEEFEKIIIETVHKQKQKTKPLKYIHSSNNIENVANQISELSENIIKKTKSIDFESIIDFIKKS